MAPQQGTRSAALVAEYASNDDHHKFEQLLGPVSSSLPTKDKCAYFATLRSSVTKMQDEVNAFLTMKMEQDKAKPSGDDRGINEMQEEENYGEEVVDGG